MNVQWEDFWWNNITGPHVVVSEVANALLENHMVVLKVPSDLPWRHSMRSAIHTTYQEHSNNTEIVIEPIDISDDNPEYKEPGRFILDRYASSTINKGYRERSKVTIQEYITAKNIIKNRVIWVKGFEKKTAEKWLKFCCGFSNRSVENGLFVLEIPEEVVVEEPDSFSVIDFSKSVSSYDVQLFNSFILDEKNTYTDFWKKYISTCIASVCDTDAELSEKLINDIDFYHVSPIDGLKNISDSPDFLKRGGDCLSSHVLSLYRKGIISEIEHRIWSAQIQILFPIIELERVSIIRKYHDELQKILDNETILQYDEVLRDAIDVELGSLCYIMKKRSFDGTRLLNIYDERERERIKFLHECRNKLAHADCCLPEEVRKLLDKPQI